MPLKELQLDFGLGAPIDPLQRIVLDPEECRPLCQNVPGGTVDDAEHLSLANRPGEKSGVADKVLQCGRKSGATNADGPLGDRTLPPPITAPLFNVHDIL